MLYLSEVIVILNAFLETGLCTAQLYEWSLISNFPSLHQMSLSAQLWAGVCLWSIYQHIHQFIPVKPATEDMKSDRSQLGLWSHNNMLSSVWQFNHLHSRNKDFISLFIYLVDIW